MKIPRWFRIEKSSASGPRENRRRESFLRETRVSQPPMPPVNQRKPAQGWPAAEKQGSPRDRSVRENRLDEVSSRGKGITSRLSERIEDPSYLGPCCPDVGRRVADTDMLREYVDSSCLWSTYHGDVSLGTTDRIQVQSNRRAQSTPASQLSFCRRRSTGARRSTACFHSPRQSKLKPSVRSRRPSLRTAPWRSFEAWAVSSQIKGC